MPLSLHLLFPKQELPSILEILSRCYLFSESYPAHLIQMEHFISFAPLPSYLFLHLHLIPCCILVCMCVCVCVCVCVVCVFGGFVELRSISASRL
jgi:hypothetical protein